MSVIKVMAVTTLADGVWVSEGVYDGVRMVVAKIYQYRGGFLTFDSKLKDLIKERHSSGWQVLVEERSPLLSQYAQRISLSDKTSKGVPFLVEAFNQYSEMKSLGLLVAANSSLSGQTSIPTSLYEREITTSGADVYRIDWSALKGAHRALLLMILSASSTVNMLSLYQSMLKRSRKSISHRLAKIFGA